MKKQISKIAMLLLSVFVLTSGNLTLKVNAQNTGTISLPGMTGVPAVEEAGHLTLAEGVTGFEDSDSVRLIVELKGDSLIAYATQKGIKVSEMDKSTRSSMVKAMASEQKATKDLIRSKRITMKELKSFNSVLNGFSIETTFKNAKEIEKLEGVQQVSIANEYGRPEPELTTSKDLINAIETWSGTGYDGEGMVIAIIDTGMDPGHRDFVLTHEEEAKIKAENLATLGSFPGTYRTAKVPYGYNYMDENQEILDLGPEASEHGMHVAGIAAANGDVENGGLKGVAPEAQLLAMKVFGNDPSMGSTFGDVIIKAIDDSVLLGADVINMSLGSTASFVQEEDLEQVAVKRAVASGVICAISSGNSDRFGSGFTDNPYPYASNPDIGVVGSPGLTSEAIQVASIDNTPRVLEYTYNGTLVNAIYEMTGKNDPIDVIPGTIEFVDAGLGYISDFTGKDLTGKVALVQRGDITFTEKILNAQNAGAAGIIVFNHEDGGENLISMAYPDNGTIPAVFISHSYGMQLLENLTSGYNTLQFLLKDDQPSKISSFTSWGTTPSLDFKPEITAPGGSIKSTAQNNGYQIMSGTSMSAPHVAGGSALVLQRINDDFDLSGAGKVTMAKNLLMSTASPQLELGEYNVKFGWTENYTSPRRQGAGLMDLYAATGTPAVVYDVATGESKVSLGEMGDTETFTLVIENFSDEPVTYKINGTVQTDLVVDGKNMVESQGVYVGGNFPIGFGKDEITVAGNSKESVSVTLNLANALVDYEDQALSTVFTNGTFIEGFVTLDAQDGFNPSLSIPYMGFYGEWDKAPVIDASIYDLENSFYGLSSMNWHQASSGNLYPLGTDVEENADIDNIAFSPNKNGVADNIIPLLSFLRNASEFEVNILGSDGENVIRELYKETYLTKNYYDGGLDSPYTTNLEWLWDGTVNGNLVPDGQYYYEIKSKIDYNEADWNTLVFPVKIDNVNPVVSGIVFDSKTNLLTVSATDNFSGISGYQIIDDQKLVLSDNDGSLLLTSAGVTSKATLVVSDFAGNSVAYALKQYLKIENRGTTVGTPTDPVTPADPLIPTPSPSPVKEPKKVTSGDTDAPVVMVLQPEFFGTYNTNTLTITGTISDSSPVKYLKIDGKDVEFKWNNLAGVWMFSHTATFEDGYISMNVESMDMAGNTLAFAHKFFVDGEKPVITVAADQPLETTLAKIRVNALFTDNLPSLKVRLNENLITNISPDWSYFDTLPSASYALSKEVALVLGSNTIVLEAEDDAGNVTKVTMTIIRKAP